MQPQHPGRRGRRLRNSKSPSARPRDSEPQAKGICRGERNMYVVMNKGRSQNDSYWEEE